MLKRKMNVVVVRLKYHDLLKESIEKICIEKDIQAGVIISSVGSLVKARIRKAGAKKIEEINQDLEIVSLNGTVSKKRVHLHICVSDENLNTYGGHLEYGCVVNSTCELAILILDKYKFDKYYDESTGYNELLIKDISEDEK